MKGTLLSLALAFTLLATCACKSGTVRNEGDTGNGNIKVGVLADLSGSGQSVKKGAELAADEINRAGGVQGRQIELIVEDDKGNADKASAAVSRLIEQRQVRAVLCGAAGSTPAAPKAQGAGVPTISLSATDPKVTQAGDYIFRVATLDASQGEQMAKYATNNIQAKTAAILSEENSDYSRGLA